MFRDVQSDEVVGIWRNPTDSDQIRRARQEFVRRPTGFQLVGYGRTSAKLVEYEIQW